MFHLARDTPSRLKSLTSCAHPRSGPNRTSREGNHSDFKEAQSSNFNYLSSRNYHGPHGTYHSYHTEHTLGNWLLNRLLKLVPTAIWLVLHRYDAHPAGVVVEQRVGETGLLITALLYVQGISHVVTSNAVWIDPDVPQGQRECLNMPQQRARPCAERLIGILNEHRRAHRRICPRTMRKSNRKKTGSSIATKVGPTGHQARTIV